MQWERAHELRVSRWVPILVVVTLVAATIVAVPSVREPVLRAAGWALVINEPISPADIIVVSTATGGAGALEAADLVQNGIATRVAVFSGPPSGEDHEFIRRGLPDEAAGHIRQLKSLGVTDVIQIPTTEAGTNDEAHALLTWCDKHQFRSIVLVTLKDHSRRSRRVLDRVMKGHPTRVTVQPARYSSFEKGTRCSCATGLDYKADAAVSVSPPQHGDKVQAWAADDPDDNDLTYVQVTCLACARGIW